MNKYALAVIFGLVALVAGVAPSLQTGAVTPAVIVAALSAAAVSALGKLMDPNSVIAFHPGVTALLLAVAAVAPMVGDAFTSGTYTQPAVWTGIVVAFINAMYAKWSVPNGLKLYRR